MNSFGSNFISFGWPAALLAPSLHGVPPALEPGPDWDGIPGSGFATAPTDPVRTTAKPALRLLTPPNQHFTSTLEVGVIGGANDGGSLANTLGIERVRFLFEGNIEEIDVPSWRVISTERGSRAYFGWWVKLKNPSTVTGSGQLFVEAVARDQTMQNRVIGPYLFSPVDQLHDLSLTVEPSRSELTGSRYQTIAAAGQFIRQSGSQNPLITIAEPGVFDIGDTTANNYGISGYCTIRASVAGVTIGKPGGFDWNDPAMSNIDMPLHIAGSNLTMDYQSFGTLLSGSNSDGRDHWFDGIEMTNGKPNGKDTPELGKPMHFNGARSVGTTWFTEVLATSLHNPFLGGTLVRGCEASGCGYDLVTNSRCVVHSTFHDHENEYWNTERDAFKVTYSGSEANATLERTGSVQGSGGGEYVLTIGTEIFRFDVGGQNNYDWYLGTSGDGYWFEDVVNWLNGFPDVVATLLLPPGEESDLAANSGSRAGTKGLGFEGANALDLTTGTKTVVSFFDVHGDIYQHSVGSLENLIIAYNRVFDVKAQLLFFSPIDTDGAGSGIVSAERDFLVFGNLMAVATDTSSYYDPDIGFCQLGRGGSNVETSHVFVAQNTFANQGWRINTSNGGLIGGDYCGFVNNTMPSLSWNGLTNSAITIDALHLHANTVLPNLATQVSFGGDETTLFADIQSGDFTPQAELLENGFAPLLDFDITRTEFPETAALGGQSAPAQAYVPSSGSGSDDPEADLITLLSATGGQSSFHHLADTTIDGTANTPDRTTNGNNLRNGNASQNPTISPAEATFDTNDVLFSDIAGGVFSVALSWTKTTSPTGAVLSGNAGSPQLNAIDGNGTAISPPVTVIDGETQTLCTNRNQLFDALDATSGEVVVYVEGFNLEGKAWLGIGRGSGTVPMSVRKAAFIDESALSATELEQARELAKEAVIQV